MDTKEHFSAAAMAELNQIQKKYKSQEGPADVAHLNGVVWACRILFLLGYVTCYMPVYYCFPSICLCMSISIWWMSVSHHVLHGGYETGRWNRKKFAMGPFRRFIDWMDWILPEAWHVEHNILHHYKLNEPEDPDFVGNRLSYLREANLSVTVKYIIVLFLAGSWKWSYYAINTYRMLHISNLEKNSRVDSQPAINQVSTPGKPTYDNLPRSFAALIGVSTFKPPTGYSQLFFCRVFLPYICYNVALLLPFIYFGCAKAALWNFLVADVLSNFYTFVCIVPNHAGGDLKAFSTSTTPLSSEWHYRQIVGSANYNCGNNVIDFCQGWLNYQIEHHLFPSLSMLSYQKMQPEVKAVCAKYNIPYVQESVWNRLSKTILFMTGQTSMPLQD